MQTSKPNAFLYFSTDVLITSAKITKVKMQAWFQVRRAQQRLRSPPIFSESMRKPDHMDNPVIIQ